MSKSLCVFCGSSTGHGSRYRDAAVEVGRIMAANGHQLVYGGGSVGLMGVVADTVLDAGGQAVGVITEQLKALEVAHLGLTELEVVADMHGRKARMAELSDGVIVLPGGFGTLDESFEILTWNQLGLVSMPLVFLDVDGYFQPLFDFVERSTADGFVNEQHGRLAQRATDAEMAVAMAAGTAPDYLPKWVD